MVQSPRLCGCIDLSLCHIYTLYLKVVCSVPGWSLGGLSAVAPTPISFCSSFFFLKISCLVLPDWTENSIALLPALGKVPSRHPTPSAPIDTHVCYKRCLHIINTSCKVAFLDRKMESCGMFFFSVLAAFESLFQKVFKPCPCFQNHILRPDKNRVSF